MSFWVHLNWAASSRMDGCFLCPGYLMGFPGKESTYSAGDLALIPRLGRSPGEMATCPLACLISTVLPASSLCLQEADSPCLAMHPLHLESRLNHSICSVNICWMGKIVSLLSSLVCNHRFIIFKIQFSIRNKILSILKNNFKHFA